MQDSRNCEAARKAPQLAGRSIDIDIVVTIVTRPRLWILFTNAVLCWINVELNSASWLMLPCCLLVTVLGILAQLFPVVHAGLPTTQTIYAIIA